MTPPKRVSNATIHLVILGLTLVLAAVTVIVNDHGSASCVDWVAVSTHIGAAKVAGEERDTQTMLTETVAASAAADDDVTVSSDLNRAAGWARAQDFKHALSDLTASYSTSSLLRCLNASPGSIDGDLNLRSVSCVQDQSFQVRSPRKESPGVPVESGPSWVRARCPIQWVESQDGGGSLLRRCEHP